MTTSNGIDPAVHELVIETALWDPDRGDFFPHEEIDCDWPQGWQDWDDRQWLEWAETTAKRDADDADWPSGTYHFVAKAVLVDGERPRTAKVYAEGSFL